MTDVTPVIERGTSETHGDQHILRFTLRLPHPVPRVWAAVASSEGLPGWLAAADPFEPRIGGAVTLRWLNTDRDGHATVASGTVTAWDIERVAEYTLEGLHGRIRFHLEPPRGDHVLLRFTNEFRGDDEAAPGLPRRLARPLPLPRRRARRIPRRLVEVDPGPVGGAARGVRGGRAVTRRHGAEDGGRHFGSGGVRSGQAIATNR